MKSACKVVCIALVALGLVGCTCLGPRDMIANYGDLQSQTMAIRSRPSEFGLETLGNTRGSASVTKLFGIKIKGDRGMAAITFLTKPEGHIPLGLEAIAASRAIDYTPGADGLYIVRVKKERTGLLPIYWTNDVTVKGKALKVKDLGIMEVERWDRLRTVEVLSTKSTSSIEKGKEKFWERIFESLFERVSAGFGILQ